MEQTTSTHTAHEHGNHEDPDYDAFLARIGARFLANVDGGTKPLFATDADDLFVGPEGGAGA